MMNDSQVLVRPARNVRGSVQLPGDKSISHRYAMLAGIAEGPSRLENYSTGADCASTLICLRSLGVVVDEQERHRQHHRSEGARSVARSSRQRARLRQLGFDDAHAQRDRRRAEVHQRDGGR